MSDTIDNVQAGSGAVQDGVRRQGRDEPQQEEVVPFASAAISAGLGLRGERGEQAADAGGAGLRAGGAQDGQRSGAARGRDGHEAGEPLASAAIPAGPAGGLRGERSEQKADSGGGGDAGTQDGIMAHIVRIWSDRLQRARLAAEGLEWRAAAEQLLLEADAASVVHRVVGGWQVEVSIWGGDQIIAGHVRPEVAEAGEDAFREVYRYILPSSLATHAVLVESYLPQSGDQNENEG